MTIRTLKPEHGNKTHIARPEDSVLQLGTDGMVVYCGHSHFSEETLEEHESLDDIDNPCRTCLMMARKHQL